MASGYKRDSRGRFAGGYGAGALGGKGAYAGRQARSGGGTSAQKKRGGSARIGMSKGIKRGAKKALIAGAVVGGGTAVGAAAGYGISKGSSAIAGAALRRSIGTKKVSRSTYRNLGAGRVEDIGATRSGGSLLDSAFRAANPMLHKDFSRGGDILTKSNSRPSTYSQRMRAARPGR